MITWLVLVGGLLGGGLALLASELRPAPPELASALDRLHRPPMRPRLPRRTPGRSVRWTGWGRGSRSCPGSGCPNGSWPWWAGRPAASWPTSWSSP
ncbi:hypothetical protein ACFQZC_32310 [Streptacidiphilus monticola]